MCGRFTQSLTWEQLRALYEPMGEPLLNLRASWNIAPTQEASVIVSGANGLEIKTMRWGLVPYWAKDMKIGASLINARIETAGEKPAFRHALQKRRCLVPASGYYEWLALPAGGGGKPRKQPFYIRRKDGLPFTFAGLWERWQDGLLSFTVLTTEAGQATRDLHLRMPVILDDAEAFAGWLGSGEVRTPPALEEKVELFPVSPKVNSPRYDEPDCIAPLASPLEREPQLL